MRPVLALVLLAGCLAPQAPAGQGLFGVAMQGPTCPVEREPPDPACADRPYEGDLVATSEDGATRVALRADAEGRFNVSLPMGEYFVRSPEPDRWPTCSSEKVGVEKGRWMPVDVRCDTGIR